jgi:hypothetical protein
MAVEARIPAGVAPSVITHLEDGLRATVAMRAAELGIDREMAVEVVPNEAQANTAAVSAAGRPLAVRIASASSEYGEAWADDVIRAVDQALLRRLSFLLDAPSTQRRAALLQERFSDDRRELFHAIPGYLLDNGVALEDPGLPDDTLAADLCESAAEIGELIIEHHSPHEICLEVSETTLRRVQAEDAGALVKARESLYAETGLQFPDVHMTPTDAPPDIVGIKLNNVRLPACHFGTAPSWNAIVGALRRSLRRHASWFVRIADVAESRNRLADVLYDLISLTRPIYPDPLLAACLRSLLANGDSTRNLPRLLWLLLEADTITIGADRVMLAESPHLSSPGVTPVVQHDPELLASALRKQVAEEAWRVGATYWDVPCVQLPIEVENALTEATELDSLAEAERRAVAAVRTVDSPFQVATHSARALRPVRYALLALPMPPHVVAAQELPPDAVPRPVG